MIHQSERSSPNDQKADVARMFSEAMARDSKEDGHHLGDGNLDAGSMLESDQTAQDGCARHLSMKWYHFELNTTNFEGQYAVELVRNPLTPRIIMHPNKGWAVRPTGDPYLPLEWVLYDVAGALPASDVAIDILHHVAEIRRVEVNDSAPGIHFIFNNGEDWEFTGGIYYPVDLLAQQVAATQQEAIANDTVAQTSAGGYAAGVAAEEFGKPVVKYTSSFALKGGVYAALGGASLAYGFSTAVSLLNFLLNSFLAQVGIAATVSLSIGIPTLTLTQILSFTTAAGTTGLLAGAALGLGVGTLAGLAVAIPRTISAWRKQRKELRLSASEKLYEKLMCHNSLKRCLNDNVLVPIDAKCPEE